MDGWFYSFGKQGKERPDPAAPRAAEKALQLVKVCVRLTSLPSDWFPCLDQPYPPPLPLLPLRNSLPRYSLPLFCDPPPVLVPPGFFLHPGANHKHTTRQFKWPLLYMQSCEHPALDIFPLKDDKSGHSQAFMTQFNLFGCDY